MQLHTAAIKLERQLGLIYLSVREVFNTRHMVSIDSLSLEPQIVERQKMDCTGIGQ